MNPLSWRKMTWAILIFSGLMLAWMISAGGASADCPPGDDACALGEDVGRGIAGTLIFGLWLVGFLILSVIWFMTRRQGRTCPHCGQDVKKGRTTCKKCGYDFTTGGKPATEIPT